MRRAASRIALKDAALCRCPAYVLARITNTTHRATNSSQPAPLLGKRLSDTAAKLGVLGTRHPFTAATQTLLISLREYSLGRARGHVSYICVASSTRFRRTLSPSGPSAVASPIQQPDAPVLLQAVL